MRDETISVLVAPTIALLGLDRAWTEPGRRLDGATRVWPSAVPINDLQLQRSKPAWLRRALRRVALWRCSRREIGLALSSSLFRSSLPGSPHSLRAMS